MDPVTSSQFFAMKDAFARQGTNIEAAYAPDGEIDYMYVVDHLLAVNRDDNLDRLQAAMPGLRRVGPEEPPRAGELMRLSIDQVSIGDGTPGSLTVPELLDQLDDNPALAGEEPLVTPVHIVHIQPGKKKICPAVEPEVPSGYPDQPWPAQAEAHEVKRNVKIGISDTGLQPGYDDSAQYPWLDGVDGEEEPLGPILPDGLQSIPKYAGHGTFVAGVAKCMAREAAVFVNSHFTTCGADAEDSIIRKLEELIQNQEPDLLSLSAGVYTRNDWPPLAFVEFWMRHPKITLIAAAGNESTNRKFYPAAFDWAVGVGALGTDQRHRAWFSNYGDWVDVYALGEGMVNAYATGVYTYQEPPKQPAKQTFNGVARWDGTSFSTPLVAGLIADEMARSGDDAATAKDTLLTKARNNPLPGVGPVLYPPQTPPIAIP
jgi:subtilisin family serine protease